MATIEGVWYLLSNRQMWRTLTPSSPWHAELVSLSASNILTLSELASEWGSVSVCTWMCDISKSSIPLTYLMWSIEGGMRSTVRTTDVKNTESVTRTHGKCIIVGNKHLDTSKWISEWMSKWVRAEWESERVYQCISVCGARMSDIRQQDLLSMWWSVVRMQHQASVSSSVMLPPASGINGRLPAFVTFFCDAVHQRNHSTKPG